MTYKEFEDKMISVGFVRIGSFLVYQSKDFDKGVTSIQIDIESDFKRHYCYVGRFGYKEPKRFVINLSNSPLEALISNVRSIIGGDIDITYSINRIVRDEKIGEILNL